MPSRFGVVLIILFWFLTTLFVVYRDILPRYLSDGPPPLRIDLADEATSQVPAKWSLYRIDDKAHIEKIGGLSTIMQYYRSDDSFWFRSEYRDLRFRFDRVELSLPRVESNVRITREGHLREQEMEGTLTLAGPFGGLTATAKLHAKVVDNMLTGRLSMTLPFGRDIDQELDPVPVTDGQILNPMMPIGRLRDVRPGRRWVIRSLDPLQQSISMLAKRNNLPMSLPADGQTLLAEVRSQSETLTPMRQIGLPADPIECWVIDYRDLGNNGVSATTWVGVNDGRVMRQEASGFGERLRFERDY